MKRFLMFFGILILVNSLGFAQKVLVRDAKPEEWGMVVKSPIFGVEFKVRKDTKVVEYRGKVYYFDSRRELDMFLENPRKYAGHYIVRRVISPVEMGKIVISPVSGKIFAVTPSVISVEYEGKIYYFLSESEYQQFEQDPYRYPEVSVSLVISTNLIVKTNYVIVTNVQLVSEYEIRTNYVIKTNVSTVEVFKPQALGQSGDIVIVKEEPKVVVVDPKPERVTTVIVTVDEERKLVKFQRRRGNQIIVVREPHQREIGKIAVSPVSGEFVVTSKSVVIRFRDNLYYLKDDREADLFIDNIDRYTR